MKRRFPVYLAIIVLCVLFFSIALAEEEVFTSGDFEYVLLDDGTAEITGWSGKAEQLDIPSKLDGHTVTSRIFSDIGG